MNKKLKKYKVSSSIRNYKLPKFSKLNKKRKILLIIIGIFALISLLRVVSVITSKGVKKEKVIRTPVEAVYTVKDKIREAIYLTERLEAISDIKVLPPNPVSGWVDTINVDIGSKVSKYQVVARIDRNVVGGEYVKAIVKAPISGEVGQIYVDKGAYVSPQTPILNIINYDQIKIYVNIPEKFANRVKVNDIALIKLETQEEEYIGKIEKVSSVIDALTGTFQAKIIIPNKQHQIKPGSFANIKVILDIKDAVIIPKDALIETEGIRPYVYVLKQSNSITNQEPAEEQLPYIAVKTYVEKGIEEEEKVEIIKGLNDRDLLITVGKEIVKPDASVFIANQKELGLIKATNIRNASEINNVKKTNTVKTKPLLLYETMEKNIKDILATIKKEK